MGGVEFDLGSNCSRAHAVSIWPLPSTGPPSGQLEVPPIACRDRIGVVPDQFAWRPAPHAQAADELGVALHAWRCAPHSHIQPCWRFVTVFTRTLFCKSFPRQL